MKNRKERIPMIDIIMAAYHGEKYIEQQIRSIMDNSYKDICLTVYDDSADVLEQDRNRVTVEKIVEKLQEEYKERLRYIKNEQNKGCIRNFLEGLKNSTAEYIMFSDQDDVWLPDKIEKSFDKIRDMEQQYGKVPIAVFSDARVVNERLEVIEESFHRSNHLNTNKLRLANLLMENKLNGCTTIVNAAVREKLITLPEHAKMHDWWVALIAASFGKIAYIKEPTMLYRQHEENVIGNQQYGSYVKKRLKSLGEQRNVLRENMKQAEEFLAIYEEELTKDKKEIIRRFANLYQYNFFLRRYLVIKAGYTKTGFVRNIGVLFVI